MTPRTAEDARLRPQPGDTLTIGERVYTVDEPRLECVRLWCTYRGVEEGTTWAYSTWSYRGDGRVWAPAAPPARCPRTDPQVGDVMRATHQGPTTATPEYTWTVTNRVGADLWVRCSDSGNVEQRTVRWWGTDTSCDYTWTWTRGEDVAPVETPAPAARCPRTDPQPGDTLRHAAKGKTWTVDARDGDHVVVRPNFMSKDHMETWTVGFWGASGVSWTYAVAETPAPEVAAPESPRAWYAARGLPACLAALPTPTDGELEALDLIRALGAGVVVTDVTPVGNVTLGGADEGVVLGSSSDDTTWFNFRLDGSEATTVNGWRSTPAEALAATRALRAAWGALARVRA